MSSSRACGTESRGSGSGTSTTKDRRFVPCGRLSIVGASASRHAAALDQRLYAASREGRQGDGQPQRSAVPGSAFVEGHEWRAASPWSFLASPAQASAPLWLKVLVIVMGLLIVAGFVVIAAEIARRMSTPNAARPPASGGTFAGAHRAAFRPPRGVDERRRRPPHVHVETQGGRPRPISSTRARRPVLGTVRIPGPVWPGRRCSTPVDPRTPDLDRAQHLRCVLGTLGIPRVNRRERSIG